MCEECGCGLPAPTRIDGKPADEIRSPLVDPAERHSHAGRHEHAHPHGHPHDHDAGHTFDHPHQHAHAHDEDHAHPHEPRTLDVHQSIFAANDRVAERNRGFFNALNLLVMNVVSSPGSGKTTLLQKTIETLGRDARIGVVVGDLETDNDARRLRTTGAPVVQISTGTLCHLDATMVARAVATMDLKALNVLVIENVGNLVCPAEFDLGEDLLVTLLSVTEGEDKPLKYPPMFRNADVVLLTKTDLAPHVDFDRAAALANIRRVSPASTIFEVSARSGDGMAAWCDFLKGRVRG
jgi:hydrogenase nickel incorporation protein HypB